MMDDLDVGDVYEALHFNSHPTILHRKTKKKKRKNGEVRLVIVVKVWLSLSGFPSSVLSCKTKF